MRNRHSAWPAILLACWLPALADEEPNWYTVEVIVFLHREDATAIDERWPTDPGYPAVETASALLPPTWPAVLRPFERLAPEAMRLGGTFRTLDRSSRYQAVLHTGWMQPGLPREQATPLLLDETSGSPLVTVPLKIDLPAEPTGFTTVPPDADEVDEVDWLARPPKLELRLDIDDEDESGIPGPEASASTRLLDGTVTLVLQRFLHVDIDLRYTSGEPLPTDAKEDTLTWRFSLDDDAWSPFDGAGPNFRAYRLKDSRRIRSGELHYFDHPKFGVIVAVHPVPEEEVEARRDAYENAYRAALLQREADRLTPREMRVP